MAVIRLTCRMPPLAVVPLTWLSAFEPTSE